MCDQGDFNLDERILCSDDTCIGLVGKDGTCRECGKPYEGTMLPSGTVEVAEDATASAAPPEPPPEDSASPEDAGTDERICCSDDTCIGIVGADGRCGTCGRPSDIS